VADLKPIADLPPQTPSLGIARYGFRSFDRQWILEDPRLMALDRPTLTASLSDRQVFLTSFITTGLGPGPAATVTCAVPDKHHFRGSFGGKDIIPLYRDAQGTPNADRQLLKAVGDLHGSGTAVGVEALFAYSYALLAGADYTQRFAAELKTPGPRVPLTADAELFGEVAEFGRGLLWLHTFGARFEEGSTPILVPSLVVKGELTLPEKPSDIKYDGEKQALKVGSGAVVGVKPDVWAFEVSGMQIVKKWLGYRTAKGAGRAASSTSPLDHIRATEWPLEWTTELLEILSVLHRTVELLPRGVELLDSILKGPLIRASDLPKPPSDMREPSGSSRGPTQAALGL